MTPAGQPTPPIEAGRERDPFATDSPASRHWPGPKDASLLPYLLLADLRLASLRRPAETGVIGPGVQVVCVLYRQPGLLMALHATGMPAWWSHYR